MQTEQVNFRASADFTSLLADLAQREGVTRSELIRRAVADRAELSGSPPINISVGPPPVSLHERAACGDADAFSHLAALHYQQAHDGAEPAPIAYAKAVTYARLALIAANTRTDWLNFMYLLDQQADALRAVGLDDLADTAHGEAVALAEFMAENGDEEIAQMVVSSASDLTPASLNIARGLQERVKEIVG